MSNHWVKKIGQICVFSLVIFLTGCSKDKSIENDIFDFYFPNRLHEVRIESTDINVFMYDTQQVDHMVPVIEVSPKASILPASHFARDFSKDVSYTVTAENGAKKNYTVKVRRSSDNALISFSIPNQTCDVLIEGSDVLVDVYRYVDVSKLSPTVVVSGGATIDPPSGSTIDFTDPVIYTITALDGSVATYTVTINKNLSRRNDIEKFEIVGTQQIFEREDDYLYIYVPYETDITNIETNVVVSHTATVSPRNGAFVDFTNPQIYTVTAVDGASKNYLVTVKKSPWREILKNGEAPFIGRDLHKMFVFRDKLWLLGGTTGIGWVKEVWNTEDGRNWNPVNLNADWGEYKRGPVHVVFKDKLWAMGGYGYVHEPPYFGWTPGEADMGIYSSSDGIHWDKHTDVAPWGKRYQPALVEFNDKLWLMGGTKDLYFATAAYNDIWSSEDGINWVREVEHAAWQGRAAINQACVVFNGALYLAGGGIIGEYATASPQNILIEYNDVWKSIDGIKWERIQMNAPWEPRLYHSVVAYNGVMYVIAGGNNKLIKNDVWKSIDGIHWEQVKHSFWRRRHAQSVVGYKGQLIMTGGNASNYVNEVWSMYLTD